MVRIVGLVTLLVMGAACSYNKMEYGQAGVFKNETTDESLKVDGTMTLPAGHFADRTMIFRFMGPNLRAGTGKLSVVKISEVDGEGEPTKKKLAPMSMEVPVNAY